MIIDLRIDLVVGDVKCVGVWELWRLRRPTPDLYAVSSGPSAAFNGASCHKMLVVRRIIAVDYVSKSF